MMTTALLFAHQLSFAAQNTLPSHPEGRVGHAADNHTMQLTTNHGAYRRSTYLTSWMVSSALHTMAPTGTLHIIPFG